jgi:sugar fermentation stimulation protein A
MDFPTPLVRGILVRRYKRFLADVVLENGDEVVAHCANPGAMTGLAEPGMTVWLEDRRGAGTKLGWSWKLVELTGGHFAVIDTSLANRVVAEALADGAVPELAGYPDIAREVTLEKGTRIDFRLSGPGGAIWVEVKSVTLRRNGRLGEFPDSVTARGAKHLATLQSSVTSGSKAAMLYVMNRTDSDHLGIAADIDRAYGQAFGAARAAGVQMLCHGIRISPTGITLGPPLPVD